MKIRNVQLTDIDEWVRMRTRLWDDEDHLPQVQSFFAGGDNIEAVTVLILERDNGKLAGFIELNLRNYAEGCTASPVPYIEGWYIDADVRRQGYGRQLVQAAETWALDQNFHELASDSEIDNTRSITAHKALGFSEVDRVVCFIKSLK